MLQSVVIGLTILATGLVTGLIYYYTNNTPQPNTYDDARYRNDDNFCASRCKYEDNCRICERPLKEEVTTIIPCKRRLHRSCFQECVNNGLNKCPICRTEMYYKAPTAQ